MGLYNFQPRFVPFILSGAKTHTIRAVRANPDKPGNTLHLYTGLRTKKAKLLMRVPCVARANIKICMRPHAQAKERKIIQYPAVFISGVELARDEREALARRDGFTDFADMIAFWNGRLPFKGHIIFWRFDGQ